MSVNTDYSPLPHLQPGIRLDPASVFLLFVPDLLWYRLLQFFPLADDSDQFVRTGLLSVPISSVDNLSYRLPD